MTFQERAELLEALAKIENRVKWYYPGPNEQNANQRRVVKLLGYIHTLKDDLKHRRKEFEIRQDAAFDYRDMAIEARDAALKEVETLKVERGAAWYAAFKNDALIEVEKERDAALKEAETLKAAHTKLDAEWLQLDAWKKHAQPALTRCGISHGRTQAELSTVLRRISKLEGAHANMCAGRDYWKGRVTFLANWLDEVTQQRDAALTRANKQAAHIKEFESSKAGALIRKARDQRNQLARYVVALIPKTLPSILRKARGYLQEKL